MGDCLWATLGCGGTGMLLLGTCLRDVVRLWQLWRHGIHTTGVVVGNRLHESSSSHRWEPVIAFHDRDGNRLEYEPTVHIDEKMAIGRQLPVVYLAHKPKIMHILRTRYVLGPILGNWLGYAVGTLFVVAAVVVGSTSCFT